ncbi:MAG: murein biosynthesis integral membrane protein MurJ [Coriobacteriales bacterium]|nr:murein biosynthesis integral membrane protein MurJ [Coriobacteriales bacterium]
MTSGPDAGGNDGQNAPAGEGEGIAGEGVGGTGATGGTGGAPVDETVGDDTATPTAPPPGADDSGEQSVEDVPSPEVIQPIDTEQKAPVALLYVPNLTWEYLSGATTGQPAQLLEGAALGNLSAPKSWANDALLEDSGIGRYALPDLPALPATAAIINKFIEEELPEGCVVIIVTAPALNGGEISRELTPVIVIGGGLSGYLTSDSTHRTGLITAQDLMLMKQHLNGDPSATSYSEATVKSTATEDSTITRIGQLRHDARTASSVLATKSPVSFAFLTLVFVTFALSILVLVLGQQETTGSRGVLIPAIRVLWLIVLAFPPATFLMFSVLPAAPTPADLVIANVVWLGAISLAALLVGWRTKWVNSLIALFSLVILIIICGQVFGGPLNSAGYLTYDVTEGSRYYGMGNEQGALFFGSWITLSGLLINRFPQARAIPAFKKWGYPLGSLVLLFIATSPWFGASFGPLVWGFIGCFFSWWLFNGWRLRWWLVASVLGGAFALAFGVLYADIALNPASHMSQVVPSMHEGFVALIVRIVTDVWSYSFSLIYEYVPAVVIVFLVFVFILLVVLRVLQPGTYREFWQRNTAFRATYSICFILAAITFVLEDSGVFTPAVLLIYPIACFVWLICDLHSWHLRILAQGAADTPITLRELQQRALGLLPHGDAEKEALETTAKLEAVAIEAEPELAAIEAVVESDGDVEDVEDDLVDASPARGKHRRGAHARIPESILIDQTDESLAESAGESTDEPTDASADELPDEQPDESTDESADEQLSEHTDEHTDESADGQPDEQADESASSRPSVGRSTATMSAATLLSRITGFARTWAMAFALGDTVLTSAYTIANNIPNMLYELFAGGVLTTAFIPIYLMQLERRGKAEGSSFASNLLSISAIILGIIALLATIFAPQVVFTQSFLKSENFDIQNAIFFFRFFAIQIVFYGVGAIISGLLNAHRSFLWPALGPVFNNIVVFITLIGYRFIARIDPNFAMIWLAVGTTLGVVAMFIVQIPALRELKIPLRFHVNLKDPALKEALKMALPATLFIVMNLIATSVMNAVALNATPKGPATMLFAWLWYQLPYGVIAVALSTALLTELSKASAAEDWGAFRSNVRLGLRSTVFLIIPLAAIIFVMSNQLAGLYHAGEFTAEGVLNVARVVAAWCVALPFYACYMFIYRIFSSMRELNRFIAIDAVGRVLQVVLYGFFATGFGLFDGLGLIGIPLADACVYALLCCVMLFVLRKRIGTFGLTGIVLDGMKILGAAIIAIAVPFTFFYGQYEQNILISLGTIALCGSFALVAFYALCRLFRIPETDMVRTLASRVKGLLQKRRS